MCRGRCCRPASITRRSSARWRPRWRTARRGHRRPGAVEGLRLHGPREAARGAGQPRRAASAADPGDPRALSAQPRAAARRLTCPTRRPSGSTSAARASVPRASRRPATFSPPSPPARRRRTPRRCRARSPNSCARSTRPALPASASACLAASMRSPGKCCPAASSISPALTFSAVSRGFRSSSTTTRTWPCARKPPSGPHEARATPSSLPSAPASAAPSSSTAPC